MRAFVLSAAIVLLIFGCVPLGKRASSNRTYLSKIEEFLNNNIPVNNQFVGKGFSHTSDGTLIGYQVYDLTDTTNVDNKFPDNKGPEIKFMQGHFYHVSPISYSMSYSSIFYVDNKEFKIYKFINCSNAGNSLNDVLKFASLAYGDAFNKEILINNINNYRKHGRYTYDDYGSELDCSLIKK